MNVQYKSFRMVELNFDYRVGVGVTPGAGADAVTASVYRPAGDRVSSERRAGGVA